MAGDAAHFTDQELIDAAEFIHKSGLPVGVSRRYSFSDVPAAVVLVVLPIVTSIVASYLYEALRSLHRGGRSEFHIRISDQDRTIEAVLKTSSDEALRDALDRLTECEPDEALLEWDEQDQCWRRLR